MKTYEFEALNASGRKKNATVKAWTEVDAKRKIQQMGLYLSSIRVQESDSASRHNESFSLFKGIKQLLFSK
ncbi:MAG: hypothetical protein ACT4NX_08845 [Deltaproteobacteria bacterium]